MAIIHKKNLLKLNRQVHMYTGLFMIPFLFIFGLSGISFNHSAFLSANRSVDFFELNENETLSEHFPNLDKLASELIDTLAYKDILDNCHIKSVKYDNTMIVRSKNKDADYRIQVDIPSNKVQIMTLPDFVADPIVARGQIDYTHKLNSNELLMDIEKIIHSKGFNSGVSRTQRIPDVVIDVESENINYRIHYNLENGQYRVNDLDQRKFKLNYLIGNSHELHGYPLSGFSLKWLWVFFADLLALLMMLWSITGLIMWYKMKKNYLIGLILLSISFILFVSIIINQYELAY